MGNKILNYEYLTLSFLLINKKDSPLSIPDYLMSAKSHVILCEREADCFYEAIVMSGNFL